MGFPRTADEADDPYWTLGVGRGVRRRRYCLQVSIAVRATRSLEGGSAVRALLADFGFAVSALAALAITAFFAFVLDALLQLVAAVLALGLFTALMERFVRSNSGRRR